MSVLNDRTRLKGYPLFHFIMKECKSCKELKAFSEFYKYSGDSHRHVPGALRPYCKICDNKIRRLYNRGITEEKFESLFFQQGEKCWICQDLFLDRRRAYIDHDHSCCSSKRSSCGKCVRGLLCVKCNTALSYFRDDIEIFKRAIQYLRQRDPII